MTAPAFTILLPVVRPPDLMTFAIESVRAQSRDDFELFIVCDGAPQETVAQALAASERDQRIRVFPFPKGERHGEAHRHATLEHARGRWVCQIADDDLWFPDHLEEMAQLLATVDFGNLLHTFVDAEDRISVYMADLANPGVRDRMTFEKHNFFGPTVSGYGIDAYRRLAQGWSPAPADIWSDLFMWRKFLQSPGATAGTRFAITSLHFPRSLREDWTIVRRRDEMARYAALAATREGHDALRQQALRSLARACVDQERGLADLQERLSGSEKKLTDREDRLEDAQRNLRAVEQQLFESERDRIDIKKKLSALEESMPVRMAARLRRLVRSFAESRGSAE
jgi:glycosyltransferase involved in cell wall biosynthesis